MHTDMIFCAIYDVKDSVVNKYGAFTSDLKAMYDGILSEGMGIVAIEHGHLHQCGADDAETASDAGGSGQPVPDKADARTQERCEGLGVDSHTDVQWDAQCQFPSRRHAGTVQGVHARPPPLGAAARQHVHTDRPVAGGMGVRLSSCLSKITTKSFRRVAKAVAGGENRPKELEKLVHGCLKHKRDGTLRRALTGCCEEQDLWWLKHWMKELKLYETQIDDALTHMEELADTNYREEVALLCTILQSEPDFSYVCHCRDWH